MFFIFVSFYCLYSGLNIRPYYDNIKIIFEAYNVLAVKLPAYAEADYLHEAFRVVRLRAGRLPKTRMQQ
jgi:hypothetical protein